MVKLNCRALVVGQLGKGVGQAQQAFLALGLLLWRGLAIAEPRLQASARFAQRCFER
jgi:hypothetical protein